MRKERGVEITVGSCYCAGESRTSGKSLIKLRFMNCDFT